MRVLLITDSLGCPRPEIDVKHTWTNKILSKYSNKVEVYTYCYPGLSADDININYVKFLKPDLIVLQVGVVDACRRALSRNELFVIRHIPIIKRLVGHFCKKWHYTITKIRNVHYLSEEKFKNIILKIKEETNAHMLFISIAPAGKGLTSKVYNVSGDIVKYNDAVQDIVGLKILNPYTECVDKYILSDGHHLNIKGNLDVFCAVDAAIETYLQEKMCIGYDSGL